MCSMILKKKEILEGKKIWPLNWKLLSSGNCSHSECLTPQSPGQLSSWCFMLTRNLLYEQILPVALAFPPLSRN